MALDGITIRALAEELSQKLVGGKVDKINQAEKDEILLTIRNNQQNYKLLISANSANPRVYLTQNYKKENPLQAPMFLMQLRKHLGGGRVLSVMQHNLDRVLLIDIQAYDELRQIRTRTLSIEIMGKHSNIILIDKPTNTIIDAIKRVPISMSSIRNVLPKTPFVLPPSQNKKSPFDQVTLEEFIQLMKHKSQPLFKGIYTTFEGISPLAAKEFCYMANISDSDTSFELEMPRYERLKNSFDRAFESISKNQFTPSIAYEKNGAPADFSALMLTQFEHIYDVQQRDSISFTAEEYFYGKDLKERILQKTQGLRKSLQIKLDRVRTKMQKQVEEINEAQNLDEFSQLGELLTANIYQLHKGMSFVDVIDYNDPEMPTISIPLSANLTPSENIQEYYKKYNKAKSRIKELGIQLDQTKSELDYLENVVVSINNIDTLEAIEDIREEMAREGYYSASIVKQNKKRALSEPMEFVSSDGTSIFVGKNNTQNDRLTLKISSPNDVWLHTKDIPGSHVIVKATFDDVSKETLYEAAQLAAYYSQSRSSAQVPVDYAPRKNVKKPSGARPGMVIYNDYGTIYVTPDENKLPQRIVKDSL